MEDLEIAIEASVMIGRVCSLIARISSMDELTTWK